MASSISFSLYLGSGQDGVEKLEALKKIAIKKGYVTQKGEPNVSKVLNEAIDKLLKDK